MTQNAINAKNTLVQFLSTNTTALVTCNTTTPADNTIPQNTEGTEVLTLSITPTSTTSNLQIIFTTSGQLSGAASLTVAVFQDTTANALAAICYPSKTSSSSEHCYINHIMASGTTSSTTFKIRVGPSANIYYINGINTGTRRFGGVANTTLTIMEYL